jgi:hypothetical protein
MERNSKNLSLLLLLIMIVLSITITETVQAQSTKPSTPIFSIQIQQGATRPAIHLVILNQAFVNSSSVDSIVYYWRVKDHNSDAWGESDSIQLQSNSITTTISVYPATLTILDILATSTLLDFQVQAATGNYTTPTYPAESTFVKSEQSVWSTTQTITNPATTSSSTPVPEFSWLMILPLLLSLLTVAVLIRKSRVS